MICRKMILILLISIALSGCVSQLTCGTDGEESYVDLVNVKDGTTVRNYAELCAFAFELEE